MVGETVSGLARTMNKELLLEDGSRSLPRGWSMGRRGGAGCGSGPDWRSGAGYAAAPRRVQLEGSPSRRASSSTALGLEPGIGDGRRVLGCIGCSIAGVG